MLSAGVRPCGSRRKPGGAAVESAVRFSHRFLAGGSGHGRRRAEQLGGSGGSRGASRGGESGAAATASGAAAWRSATRPSSGLQMGLRWPGRLQRRPAHVRRPCRCSALVCARICSCSRRADRRCCVCMCVRGTRPEARRKGPTLPHTAEQAAAQRYLLRVPITCKNLIFSSLNYTHSRDCSRLQRGNT